jgi:uncharacterized protein (TIGR02118 family)
MICVMAVYPNREGSRFDIDYYATRHAAFARGLLEPLGLTGLRIMAGEMALDDGAPAFWAVSEMTFTSRGAFDAAMAQCGAALFADAPHYTDVEPILQIASSLPSPIQEH